ncbi:MAG: hypothetical protein AAFU79_17935 [Myxococcota bacterium]
MHVGFGDLLEDEKPEGTELREVVLSQEQRADLMLIRRKAPAVEPRWRLRPL